MIMKPPNCSKVSQILRYCIGINPPTTFEPSSGGSGIRLKKASIRLINTVKLSMICGMLWWLMIPCPIRNCCITPSINAKTIFAPGPASEIQIISRRGLLRYAGLTGTGLAQPKCTSSNASVPIGSRCESGLSVNRPALLAVGSPNLYAIIP